LVCRFREEHRLRVFENKVLRKIYGAKGDEVTGDWTRLHNKEPHNLNFPPPDKKKPRVRWAGRVARMGERKNAYRFRSEKYRKEKTWIGLGVGGKIILK
jgi:hypothetical protein